MRLRDRCLEAYRTAKQHGKFSDSPWERVTGLVGDLFVSPTLPNIVLGASITASIQALFGMVPLGFVAGSWAIWLVTVLVYAIGDELRTAYKAASNTLEESDLPGYHW